MLDVPPGYCNCHQMQGFLIKTPQQATPCLLRFHTIRQTASQLFHKTPAAADGNCNPPVYLLSTAAAVMAGEYINSPASPCECLQKHSMSRAGGVT